MRNFNSEPASRITVCGTGIENSFIPHSAFRIQHSALFYVLRLFSQLLDLGFDLDRRVAN